MATVNPYLTFNGTCEKAFEFYKTIFGGTFQFSGRFSEMPPNSEMPPILDEDKNKIMHISLPISTETILMGSDVLNGEDIIEGNNCTISINCITTDEVNKIFRGLSAGGKVTMPLNKTFWGSYFGMFTDKFGIHWMIGCEAEEKSKH